MEVVFLAGNDGQMDYSIGVVTYLGRFEDYFVPLVKELVKVFPDKEIICVLNGHHDAKAQIRYLRNATSFLSGHKNIRYITYEKSQSLAKCWNWIMLMCSGDRALILNDDVRVEMLFRDDFERLLKRNADFFSINKSWSHFLISKKTIKEIGWFDERLLGNGHEDSDYVYRLTLKKRAVPYYDARGLKNYVAPPTNAGWADFSEISEGKYSKVNKDFMAEKWDIRKVPKDELHPYGDDAKLRSGMETPVFYDFSLLDEKVDFARIERIGRKWSLKDSVWVPVSMVLGSAKILMRKLYVRIMS